VERSTLDFLTKEPLEGILLADLLSRGPLPAEEARQYAVELGQALQIVHKAGVLHAQLSPYSILIASGKAHLLEPIAGGDSRSAPYRSPEQVRGEEIDFRSDVFSYGAVLYEMVSGRRAFTGADEELDRQILEGQPALLNGKGPTLVAMEREIASCLVKNPRLRTQTVQKAVNGLRVGFVLARPVVYKRTRTTVRAHAPMVPQTPEGRWARIRFQFPGAPDRFFSWKFWAACFALFALAMIGFSAMLLVRKPATTAMYSFKISTPENVRLPGTPSVSPDGRHLAYAATGPDGERTLWVRPLDAERSTPVTGTEGSFAPFWSPDSKQIGFFANRKLKKVTIDGGAVEILCDADLRPGGGTWNADGTILFASGLAGGLQRVSANGGKPEPVLTPDNSRKERAFRWPQFLPDGKHFLFFALTDSPATSGIYSGTLGKPAYDLIAPSETNGVYSSAAGAVSRNKGYLLFIRDRMLVAQPFDAQRLTLSGEPFAIRDDVGSMTSMSMAPISVSDGAVLVYQTVGRPTRQLVWMNRDGTESGAVKDAGEWGPPRISPDGTRALAAKLGADGKNADLWMLDLNGAASQITDTPVSETSPVWSPDGTRIAYSILESPEGNFNLYLRPVNGGPAELILKNNSSKYATDWSRDGRYLIFTVSSEISRSDVWALAMGERHEGERHSGPILATIHTEGYAALSPDNRWLAYQSDETGRNEVYVQRFEGIISGTQRRWTISEAGGGLPRWRADGKELFFLTNTGSVMAASVHPVENDLEFEPPHRLFQTQPMPKLWNLYDVAGNGQRFLLNLPLELSNDSSIVVVTSWTDTLKQ